MNTYTTIWAMWITVAATALGISGIGFASPCFTIWVMVLFGAGFLAVLAVLLTLWLLRRQRAYDRSGAALFQSARAGQLALTTLHELDKRSV